MNPFNYPLVLSLVLIVCYVLYFLYLTHLHSLLKTIKAENRSVSPNTVWILALTFLNLLSFGMVGIVIPKPLTFLGSVFLIVVQFYLVAKTADSIKREFISRKMEVDDKPTFALGVWMCVLDFVCHLCFYLDYAVLGMVGYVVFVICFIVYWVEINNIRKELKAMPLLSATDDSIFDNL